jgi:hypothetical protein
MIADDFVGQVSVIDGDTLDIHGPHIRLWGVDAPESSQLCRGEDSSQFRCGAQAANDLDAFIARRPVNCSRATLIDMVSANGSCAMALHWIGLNTRRADMTALSAMLNHRPGNWAATSSRGSIALASVRMENDRLFG